MSKLVLVTGAGASRELGRDRELPLMSEWSELLCEELDGREQGLAQAVGLRAQMDSVEFERALGSLTTYARSRELAPRYFGLTGTKPNSVPSNVKQAYDKETKRIKDAIEGLRTSLYAEFSTGRIDEAKAAGAYESLLRRLDNPQWLVIATTNYDPAAELALDTLGRPADTGFRRPPARTPELSPAGLIDRALDSEAIPVLHLHGAVGWYEEGGRVLEYSPDQTYNPTHGTPAVLYPDPDKDPTQDAAVQALWVEFGKALETADQILVLGHSLNDPVLIEALAQYARRNRLAVALDFPHDHAEAESAVHEKLPGAAVVEMHMGPQVTIGPRFGEWRAVPLES